MQKSFSTIFREAKEDVKSLVGAKVSLWRIEAYEKGVPAGLNAAVFTIAGVLAIVALGFLLLACAFAFALIFANGDPYVTVRSIALGCTCMGVLFGLLAGITIAIRKWIVKKYSDKIINNMLDDMEKKEALKSDPVSVMYEPTDPVSDKDLEDDLVNTNDAFEEETEEEETEHIKPITYEEL